MTVKEMLPPCSLASFVTVAVISSRNVLTSLGWMTTTRGEAVGSSNTAILAGLVTTSPRARGSPLA